MKRLTNAYKQLVLYLDGTLPPPKKYIRNKPENLYPTTT